MKKKIIVIAAAALVVALAATGATLAWFTDSETVMNTFTVGNVQITLDEAKLGSTTGERTTSGNIYHIVPGATLPKDPKITVSATSESCYVYALIENGLGTAATPVIESGWALVTGTTNLYKYNTIVAKDAANKGMFLFKTVTIEGTLTNDQAAALKDKTIVVNAYAIQSENITSGQADTEVKAFYGARVKLAP